MPPKQVTDAPVVYGPDQRRMLLDGDLAGMRRGTAEEIHERVLVQVFGGTQRQRHVRRDMQWVVYEKLLGQRPVKPPQTLAINRHAQMPGYMPADVAEFFPPPHYVLIHKFFREPPHIIEIGRAAGRERVKMSVVAGSV